MTTFYDRTTKNVNPPECKRCSNNVFEVRKGSGPHYQGLWCPNCEAFIKWLPKPKEHQLKAEALLNKHGSVLTLWERDFLASVFNSATLTQKQTQVFENIARRYGHE